MWEGKGVEKQNSQGLLGDPKDFNKTETGIENGEGRGCRKISPEGNRYSGEKIEKKRGTKVSPVDLEILATVKKGLKRLRIKRVSKLSVWAACLVAFWGAFHLAKILAKNTSKFDKFSDLLWADIVRNESQGKITLKIKSAKFPGPPGNKAEIFEIGQPLFCPITALSSAETSQKNLIIIYISTTRRN